MHLTKNEFPVDVDDQSSIIPGSGGARQSKLSPIGVTTDSLYSDTKTIVDAIQRGCRISKNGPCLGWRDSNSDYKWLTYEEVIERSINISSGLISTGIKRGQDTFIGMFAQNSVEWVLVEHACYRQSLVTVPLYETLGPDAITFILNHVEAEVVVCDNENKVISLINARSKIPSLKCIIAIQNIRQEVKKRAVETDIVLHRLKDIEDLGKKEPQYLKPPCPSDLATICYTSGTTGNPKGVMLTHSNFIADASAVIKHLGSDFIGPGDRHISYLPLAHVFERINQVLLFICGASIGFFRGDIKLLIEDISALKPTMFTAVPRVLNKIYDKIQNQVNSSMVKKFLINAALKLKEAELKRGIIRNDSIWDYLVFNKIQSVLGGKVRLLISSGAPIRDDVLNFFRCSLGCVVIQAYGQTESAGAISLNVIGEHAPGTVGPPLPCCFVKLNDVPEMNYYAKNGEGEVLVKGANITKGYYKDPVKTAETLNAENWFYTGDIGRWTQIGSLAIIDRKKNFLKLSQGEYVSPEKVEAIYLSSPYVEHIFVHGESFQNCLVAIMVPNQEELLSWCSELGVKGSFESICQNKVVIKHLLKHLFKLGQDAGLNSFEQVKALYVYPEGFSQENNILTATMKVKRNECYKKFSDVIKQMYKSLNDEQKR